MCKFFEITFFYAVSFLGTASLATACPLCNSEIGKRVRAGIFNEEFGDNLVLTLTPLVVMSGIVMLIHFGVPWSREVSQLGIAEEDIPRSKTKESEHG